MSLIYPQVPGWKGQITSQDAAEILHRSGRAQRLRDVVFAWFAEGNTGTADELALLLNEDKLAIRPRISELVGEELLEPTGERRKNQGGRAATVWRLRSHA